MAKQAKVKLTRVQELDVEVKKWTLRREDAIVTLVKASNALREAQRHLERAKRSEAKKKREAKLEVLQRSSRGPLETPPAKAAGSPGPKLLEDVLNGRAPKQFG